MNALFENALGIIDPWKVTSIDFDKSKKKLDICIDFTRGATFLDDSVKGENKKEYKAYDTVQKTWKHLNFFEHECYLHARIPRIKKDDGSIKMIPPPWNGAVSGFTLLFEALLMQLCKMMPVHNVSQLTGVSDYKIWRVLDTYIDLAKTDEDLSNIATIGMDETSVAKGHDYITLFVDLEERKTVYISDGKASDTVSDFVETLESKNGQRGQVKDVSCDMSPAFIKGVNKSLPEAKITFDKFHILKLINEAVDKVRREEAKTNPLLIGNRYIFLKNEKNLTKNQAITRDKLMLPRLNLKSIRALMIRESFQQIYQSKSNCEFKELLQKWYYWATHSQLAPIVKVAKTIKNHWDGVLRWKISQLNNGILEGLNSVLQAAKRKARGYKKGHFKTIAYLITGKLDFSKINKNCLPT